MKIVIPTDTNSEVTTVCPSFGRTPFFMIYDTETGKKDFLENSAASSSGGAGIKAAQTLIDLGIEVLLTPRCGENAADLLGAAGIKMYKTVGTSTDDNIHDFENGKLLPLADIHPGFHNHGEK